MSLVARLRAEGLSWRDVGRELGVGVATARAAFQDRAKNLSKPCRYLPDVVYRYFGTLIVVAFLGCG